MRFVLLFICLSLATLAPVRGQSTRTDEKLDLILAQLQKQEVAIARLEERVSQLEKRVDERFVQLDSRVNQQFDSYNGRMDDFRSTQAWMYSSMLALMGILVGFVLWDRRSMIMPLEKRASALEDLQHKELDLARLQVQNHNALANALKEFAQTNPELRRILNQHGIL